MKLSCAAGEPDSLRADAIALGEAALQAIDTGAALKRAVRLDAASIAVADQEYPLPKGRLLLVAVGKCAAAASQVLGELLAENLRGGVVLDLLPAGTHRLHHALSYRQGTHPLPSSANVRAAQGVVNLLAGAEAEDLVLFVISGGGSTLLCLPPPGINWEDEAALFASLSRAGATIVDINTVRKHTSLARGGFLAMQAYPAGSLSLVFSDVPGASVEFVASGPTVRDGTTVSDARRVLERHGLLNTLDTSRLLETPKDGRYFERATHVMVVSNGQALEAMARLAAERGLVARVVETAFFGEARELAGRVVSDLRSQPSGTALLYGGESTVTVRGAGRGGRNAELALAALPLLREGECVLALASDGQDHSEYAGAIADAATTARAAALGLDATKFLEDNDAYGFYERTGDALISGPTGSNVADLIVALKR